MRKNITRILAAVLVILMVLPFVSCGQKYDRYITIPENTAAGEYAGKTVILHTNDVHGALEGYSYLPALKSEFESKGGTVVLVDAGDFTNGTIYVSVSKGQSAVALMESVNYNVVALGNHELDYGYDQLASNVKDARFKTICSNVYKDGKTIFQENTVVKVGDLKIGFFALLTPETQTKVNPSTIQGLSFTEKEEMYKIAKQQVEELKKVSDVIICLAHLGVDEESAGNRSYDIYNNVPGIDFIIDGHSHTVMTRGTNGEPIQSTGTAFESVGEIVIDNKTKKIEDNNLLMIGEGSERKQDETVLKAAQQIIADIDTEYGKKIAETKVDLLGEKAIVRSEETNLGDLISDAMIWSVTNGTELKVDKDHVLAVMNGGGIRASIAKGDISRSSIKTVLPFGNTIAVNYIKGSELLEALEASTYCSPTSLGGFPQISGMKIKVDTTVEFDQGLEYPDSTYYAPKSIKRVTILEINGKAFDPDATYAVVTSSICAAGGDTYYAFLRSSKEGNGFDTSITIDDGLVDFIINKLDGVIGDEYAAPKGRIEIIK